MLGHVNGPGRSVAVKRNRPGVKSACHLGKERQIWAVSLSKAHAYGIWARMDSIGPRKT